MDPLQEKLSADSLYEQICLSLCQYQEALKSGNLVNLDGLDQKVNSLCQAVMGLPKEEARAYSGQLQELMRQIAALGARMETAKNQLQGQIEDLHLHRKASVAYKTRDVLDTAKKPHATASENKQEE